jgi:hypothetical protein
MQQPTKFEPMLNLKAAKVLHLALLPALLARAEEVIGQVAVAHGRYWHSAGGLACTPFPGRMRRLSGAENGQQHERHSNHRTP